MRRLFPTRFRMLTAISVILVGFVVEFGAGRAYCHAQFQRYFEGLGAPEAQVSPVERFVFSLLLTEAHPRAQAAMPQTAQKTALN